ncbi:MAG TPA: NAD(P)H-hydrate dehydratase [Methylophilaceae bacterium]|nr:NAD(P)H-hydrate dehydratase [Methylophilaceae bacterium]HQR60235.1 NAD(P)H-hydrate dehydratase [Methylophilaceae bacterium]
MTPLYLTSQIRTMEQAHGSAGLMEKAGLAAAELSRALLSEEADALLVLAGPGNNGGDALVAARHLRHDWHRVDVVFTGSADKLPADASDAYDAWLACGGEVLAAIPAGKGYGLIIDGLFGIGLTRELDVRHRDIVRQVNAMDVTVLALDVPSGLDADTGRILGCAIKADHTLAFLGLKPGLFTLDGPDHAGLVHVTDLGIEADPSGAQPGWLIDTPPTLPAPRRRNSHKGSYGSAGILGGDTAMVGAALLAGRAALLAGAGRVYAGLLAEHAPVVDFGQPELMLRSAGTLFDIAPFGVLAAGPGMGRSQRAEAALLRAIHTPAPLLLDADALHLIAANDQLRDQFHQRTHGNILTPHPGEAAALLGCSVAEIQADRVASALDIAQACNAITVLKGCGSVIATPDGRWFVNASGNAGLASAGMGDVLSGLIAALVAQDMTPEAATLLGVYLHGAAADSLVGAGVGPVGLTASEVAQEARDLLNQWIYGTR